MTTHGCVQCPRCGATCAICHGCIHPPARAFPPPTAGYVCTTCKDTHKMVLRSSLGDEREVMCMWCPRPCEACRWRLDGSMGMTAAGLRPIDEGIGLPYCATTPCPCTCHRAQDGAPASAPTGPGAAMNETLVHCGSAACGSDGGSFAPCFCSCSRCRVPPPLVDLAAKIREAHAKACRADADHGPQGNLACLVDAIVSLKIEAQAPAAPEVTWTTNADAGDSTGRCSVCGDERDEPHSWEECARGLAAREVAALDRAIELEVVRDAALAELASVDAIIERANDHLFEIDPHPEHQIECHADGLPAAFRRLTNRAADALSVLQERIQKRMERVLDDRATQGAAR